MFWKKKKITVRKLADCIDSEKGKSFLIIGAGGTLREYAESIKAVIESKKLVTIGINKMTEFHVPDYHLWTNKQRWRDFGNCISEKSIMMFGAGLSEKLIRKHYKGDYIVVDYENNDGQDTAYRNGVIYGNFRTAGCLAIMVCHLLGAENVSIVGMDGYTLHGREKIESGQQHHHVYGKGYTDHATWEQCVEKDRLVYETLRQVEAFGVRVKILTPTKFSDFYDGTVLEKIKKS